MPFQALGLAPGILKAVAEAGYTEPTPIQTVAIPLVLAGRDLIGIAQTGTGKTAAFTLPLLTRLAAHPSPQRGIRALVIAPTRELAAQIEENVRAYGRHLRLRATAIFGGVSERPQIDALRHGAEIVIATPGRLLDLMNQGHVHFDQLEFLVLDEADRMLDMGFLPDIRRIVRQLPQKRQTLLFSATLSQEIESLTHEFLHAPKTVQIGRRANPAETVAQLVYEIPKNLKTSLLLHILRDPAMNMVLIFSRMKHGADRIARQLEAKGVSTATLHSNRSQNQRLRALKDFKSGAVRVLVATDIAARGIDVDDISHVVNYDFPMHPEDYVHRIGRTGRAHAVGDAISFVTPDDLGALRALERFIGRGIVRKRAEGFDYHQAPTSRDEGQTEPFRPHSQPPRRPHSRPHGQQHSQGQPGSQSQPQSRSHGHSRPQGQARSQSQPHPRQGSSPRQGFSRDARPNPYGNRPQHRRRWQR